MAARSSGSKVVALAVAATVGAVGVGCIYVPYFADRDKLRGLHEEGDAGLSDREKRELDAMMRQIQQQSQQQQQIGGGGGGVAERSPMNSNSMWTRLNRAATGKKE